MTDQTVEGVKEEIQYQTISEFLEGTPPNQLIHISDLAQHKSTNYGWRDVMRTPEIQLHCDHEDCNGIRGTVGTLFLSVHKYGERWKNVTYVPVRGGYRGRPLTVDKGEWKKHCPTRRSSRAHTSADQFAIGLQR